MAKRKPKLRDVRYVYIGLGYEVQLRRAGDWHYYKLIANEEMARCEKLILADFLGPIIREARDNGVNDAIEAVQEYCDDNPDVDCFCDLILNAIREATGVKE